MSTEFSIVVENISKQYFQKGGNAFWALDEVSFQVRKGEMLGVIGSNGSGKSTLLRILSGIIRPDKGRAIIDGTYSSVLDIGSGFHPDLTGIENLRLKAELLGKKNQLDQTTIDKIIEFSGLEQFIYEPVKNYSSGMFIRLAFSIFRYLKHDILLIDEVLSAGDLEFQNRIHDSGFLKKASGIVVSHELETIVEYCDRILVLEKGKVVEISDSRTSITNYQKSKNLEIEACLLNLNPVQIDRVVDTDVRIDRFYLKSKGDDNKITSAQTSNFRIELSNIGATDRNLILIPFVRTVGRKVDLHADSHSIWENGLPVTVKTGKSYHLDFEYPENFFGKGYYSLGLVVASSERLLERWEDLAYFQIDGNDWEKDKLWDNMFLQNRIRLNWEFAERDC